jgi:hypothetical protein
MVSFGQGSRYVISTTVEIAAKSFEFSVRIAAPSSRAEHVHRRRDH